jgi:hypothetical protein
LQQVRLGATEGDPVPINNTINNLDDNNGSSQEPCPKSPKDQQFHLHHGFFDHDQAFSAYREHTVNQFPYNPTTYDYSYI